jgi:hypothetical protein
MGLQSVLVELSSPMTLAEIAPNSGGQPKYPQEHPLDVT